MIQQPGFGFDDLARDEAKHAIARAVEFLQIVHSRMSPHFSISKRLGRAPSRFRKDSSIFSR